MTSFKQDNNHSSGSAPESAGKLAIANTKLATQDSAALSKTTSSLPQAYHEQPVILEKPAIWARATLWTIIALAITTVTWANLAQIEESVPAIGKLEPDGAVKEIQAPTGGVIRSVEVKDGQTVKKGDLLVTLDPTASQADRDSLIKSKAALESENSFYAAQLNGFNLQDELSADTNTDFVATQQRLLSASRAEFQSRVASAQLEINQLRTQLAQAQQQIISARNILIQNDGILKQSEDIRDTNSQILSDMAPVAESGALSRLQYRQQQQRVQSAQADVLNRQSQIESSKGEIARLTKEEQRLSEAIAQSEQKLNNTVSLSAKDILSRISENQKRINEINGQLSKAEQSLKYQEIYSPIDGKVFDVQVGLAGVITAANSAQPLMKIVPNDKLLAKVYITNKDIGFVKEGMPADIKIDSFPHLEFGAIKGKLINIGSDALPPVPERQFYSFPAKVEMESQTIQAGGKTIPLQAGMSVNTNILVRKRSVMTIFLGQFTSKVDSFQNVR